MNLIEKTIFTEIKNNQIFLNKIKIIISVILFILLSNFYFLYKYITLYYILIFLSFYILILFLGGFILKKYFVYYKYFNICVDIILISIFAQILVKYSENLIISIYFIPFLITILGIYSLGFQKFYTIIFGLYSIIISIYLLYVDKLLDKYSIIIVILFFIFYLANIYNNHYLKKIINKIAHFKELEKFTHSNLLKNIEKNPEILNQIGEKKELVIFFLDIRGFSLLSEKLNAKEIFEILNIYLGNFTEIIQKNNGTIDKYIGDCIMRYFEGDDMFLNSYKSSIEILKELENINKKTKLEVRIGIGMHFGEIFLGSIGNKYRMDYTIIGDNVNIASRLESLTRKLKANIVVSKCYFDHINFENNFKPAGKQELKGKNNTIEVYTL